MGIAEKAKNAMSHVKEGAADAAATVKHGGKNQDAHGTTAGTHDARPGEEKSNTQAAKDTMKDAMSNAKHAGKGNLGPAQGHEYSNATTGQQTHTSGTTLDRPEHGVHAPGHHEHGTHVSGHHEHGVHAPGHHEHGVHAPGHHEHGTHGTTGVAPIGDSRVTPVGGTSGVGGQPGMVGNEGNTGIGGVGGHSGVGGVGGVGGDSGVGGRSGNTVGGVGGNSGIGGPGVTQDGPGRV